MTNFRSAAIATGNQINDSAYDNVKLVADDIGHVTNVSTAIDDGTFDNVDLVIQEPLKSNINNVGSNIDSVTTAAEGMTDIVTVNDNMVEITNVADNMVDINSVVTDVIPNMSEILTADDNAIIASDKATESAQSAVEALQSAASASSSEVNAASSAGSASTSAVSANNSAIVATTNAEASLVSATAAEAARDQALAAFDNFDDKYLGEKASDPSVDNDGDALVTGALYYNNVDEVMKVYTGTLWVAAYASLSGALLVNNNLSDLNNAASARTNLDVYERAVTDRLLQMNEDTNEASGFVREFPLTMGVIELSPDGTLIHRIDHNGVYSSNSTGVFYDGTSAGIREFSISPVSVADGGDGTYAVYVEGTKFIRTEAERVNATPATGLQFIYTEIDGSLGIDTVFTADYFEDRPIVATLYGNYPLGEVVIFGDERHGIQMDGATHKYLHFTQGTQYISGMEIQGLVAGGTTFTQITSGIAYDEDIELTPLQTSVATCWYFLYDAGEGKNGWAVEAANSNVGCLAGGVAQYNAELSPGEWGLSSVTGNDTMIMFVALTNNAINNYTKIIGQEVYADAKDARADISNALSKLVLAGLPSPEFLPIAAIIINSSGEVVVQSDGSVAYDLRNVTVTGAGTSSSTAVYHEDLLGRDVINAHPISAVTGLQSELDSKVDDSQVLTNVPLGAMFTDTTYTNVSAFVNDVGYVTSSGNTIIGTDTDVVTSGNTIIGGIELTDGVIISTSTRAITLSDLGYTGESNATADQTEAEILGLITGIDFGSIG